MDPQLNIRSMLALRLFTSTELVGCAWFTGGDQQLR